jgi:putative ABC transport system permease protein
MNWIFDSFRIPLCFLRASYTRLTLTISALAAGVALVCAIDLVNQSVLAAFVEVVDTMAGRAALQVSTGSSGLFAEEVADTVAAVPGVELAVPVVSANAFVTDGSGEILTVHGVDITNDAAIRVYEARDPGGSPIRDPLVFLNHPESLLLTREFAERKHVAVGDSIELETPTGRRRFTIRGLLDPEGVARVYGGNLLVMDLQAAEVAFTEPGLINRVDVVVKRDEDVGRVGSGIATILPQGLRVDPPAQRKADLHAVMRSLQAVLGAVALLGLAGAFLIAFNRLAAVFDERAWQLGVMRAVGARVRAVWLELLKEAFLLGAGGVLIGIPLGVGLGRLLLPLVATTTALSSRMTAPDAKFTLRASSLALAAALGFVTALLAAARPAWRAARVSLSETLLRRGVEVSTQTTRVAWLVRMLVVSASACAIAVQAAGGSPPWGLAATFGIMTAAALFARPLVGLLSLPSVRAASHLTASGLFAMTAFTRRPGRAGLTVATLGVGFGSVIWLSIVAQSFERSVMSAVRDVLRGDLTVSSTYLGAGFVEAPIDDALVTELASVPGVVAAVGESMVDWQYAGGPIVVSSFDAAYVKDGAFGEWPLVGRALPDVREGFARGDTALVSTNFVMHLAKGVGDYVTLDTPSGPLTLRIGGVTASLVSPRGTIIVAREVYERQWKDPHIVHILIRTTTGSVASVRSTIAERFGRRYSLKILSAAELLDWFAGQVHRAFAGLYVVAGLILLVVLFGATDTLAAGIIERRHEIGAIRAAGVRARHVRHMVLIEAALLGVLGLLLASAIGFTLGVFWVQVVFPHMLGWVLELHIPYEQLLMVGIASMAICLLAAVLPAIRAARLEPALALRYE